MYFFFFFMCEFDIHCESNHWTKHILQALTRPVNLIVFFNFLFHISFLLSAKDTLRWLNFKNNIQPQYFYVFNIFFIFFIFKSLIKTFILFEFKKNWFLGFYDLLLLGRTKNTKLHAVMLFKKKSENKEIKVCCSTCVTHFRSKTLCSNSFNFNYHILSDFNLIQISLLLFIYLFICFYGKVKFYLKKEEEKKKTRKSSGNFGEQRSILIFFFSFFCEYSLFGFLFPFFFYVNDDGSSSSCRSSANGHSNFPIKRLDSGLNPSLHITLNDPFHLNFIFSL